jgi:hypothetical protein
MNSQTLSNWVQAATGLAVIIGLGFVVWELQQNREATQSQLSSDGWQMVTAQEVAVMGESPANALAKACKDPNEMTDAELVVLHNYYNNILNNHMRRLQSLSRRGSFYTEDVWKQSARYAFGLIFSTPVGRAWWQQAISHEDELQAIGDDYLNRGEYWDCSTSEWRALISKEIE